MLKQHMQRLSPPQCTSCKYHYVLRDSPPKACLPQSLSHAQAKRTASTAPCMRRHCAGTHVPLRKPQRGGPYLREALDVCCILLSCFLGCANGGIPKQVQHVVHLQHRPLPQSGPDWSLQPVSLLQRQ